MNRVLNAVLTPDLSLAFEWESVEERIDKGQERIQEEFFARYQKETGAALLFIGFVEKEVPLSPSLAFFRAVSAWFVHQLCTTPDIEQQRQAFMADLPSEDQTRLLAQIPFFSGSENLNAAAMAHFWTLINTAFQTTIKSYAGTVDAFIRENSAHHHLAGRVYFHLVESKKEEAPFAFMATYSTHDRSAKGHAKHVPLSYALTEFCKDNAKLLDLLSTVHLAARESALIKTLLDSGEIFHPLAWSPQEALVFLKEIPLYEKSGVLCRMPNWWKPGSNQPRLTVNIGEKEPSRFGWDTLLDFHLDIALGETKLTPKEIHDILKQTQGLALIKGKWIEIDRDKLTQALSLYEKAIGAAGKQGLTLAEAMRLQIDAQKMLNQTQTGNLVDVAHGQWLSGLTAKLANINAMEKMNPGKGFKAELRHYQQKGLNWLCFLNRLGFGACLADDMGLGKTIQLLALINTLKTKKETPPHLLVLPASLIQNWVNEIHRFAPDITFLVLHPSFHNEKQPVFSDKTAPKGLNQYDLVITTYAACRKYGWLSETPWNIIILDEAQAIKNPGAAQTRAVKQLQGQNRIIMTGTPVENRLTDLWSLFDFLNPGLLGSGAEFTRFAKKLKNQPEGYARLKQTIRPFVLRRLKSDKTVIADLPDKIEMKSYADLSKTQVVLYQALLAELTQTLATTEGLHRKGLILASLMKFKQLCNHPDQYLGSHGFAEAEGGKFPRLREICETVLEKRERMLVFTQFQEMTAPLESFLQGVFGRAGVVLHGKIAIGKRAALVDKFQGKEYVPFMVLSLKVGGVGLNLTAANHVVHFDRWWNPAVENQATDRAFRIGQNRNVMVHKFITRGTIEEKIDAMLEDKKRLSEEVIHSGNEEWITGMDNDKLIQLFSLSL